MESMQIDKCQFANNNLTAARFLNVVFDTTALLQNDLTRLALIGGLQRNVAWAKSDFSSVTLQLKSFEQAMFIGSKIVGWQMSGARFLRCNFSECEISQSSFSGAALTQSLFIDASLTDVDFYGADLTQALFVKAKIQQCDFKKTELSASNFGEARISESQFDGSHLDGATFEAAKLEGCVFLNANMDGASLLRTELAGCDFAGVQATYINTNQITTNDSKLSAFEGALTLPEIPGRVEAEFVLQQRGLI